MLAIVPSSLPELTTVEMVYCFFNGSLNVGFKLLLNWTYILILLLFQL